MKNLKIKKKSSKHYLLTPIYPLLSHCWCFSVLGPIVAHFHIDKPCLSCIQDLGKWTSSARLLLFPKCKDSFPPLNSYSTLFISSLQPLVPTYLFMSISLVYKNPLHFGETLVSVILVWSIFLSLQGASDTDLLPKGRLSFKFIEEITLSSFLHYSLSSPTGLLIQRKRERNASLCPPIICLRSGCKDGI